jgi:Rrf2 family protein
MQLRAPVEWALHCCAILAGLAPGRYLPTRDLADFHGVPKEYLSKALQALSQAGLVEGTLGPSGGYRLARPPGALSFLDIVEAVEGRGPTFVCTNIRRNNPCLSGAEAKTLCTDKKPCAIAKVMWEADRNWRASLRTVSLADLEKTLESHLPAGLRRRAAAWIDGHS